jgi:hypothetical protein
LRLLTVTLGARGKVIHLSSSGPVQNADLWSLDGELAFRIPVATLEPYFMLGGGYSALGGVHDAVSGVNDGLDITGANLRAALGLDYFVTPTFSIGAKATAEVLFLNREGVPIRDLATPQSVDTVGEARARVLEADGSAAGSAIGFFITPGLHF